MKYLIWPIIISLIIVRYFTTRPVYRNGDYVRISGPVLTDPRVFENSQYLKLSGLAVYLPKFPAVRYGDRIVMEGKVEDGKLKDPKLVILSSEKVFGSNFRNKMISFYQAVLPEPEAGLLAGILLGSKGAVLPDFYRSAKLTGVAHVVVASGTNITFIVSFLTGVAYLFLPRRKSIFFIILSIILYLFIAGFEAPLIRAAIMSLFLIGSQGAGRINLPWRGYFLTAGLMLIYKPLWISDIGFILSFVSVASLMLFEKKICLRLHTLPNFLKEGLSTSLAAQAGITPVLFITFGQFNLLSPLINALVLWTVPPVMVLGALGGITGLVFEPVGRLFLYLSYPLLWWFVSIVELTS